MSELIHVVAAVITNLQGEILIAQRPLHKHQGGLWEFPGGKREAGESTESALQRELQEELGICIEEYQPLLVVRHDYPDKSVLLDVWRVTSFSGEAYGKENQQVCWTSLEAITEYKFPLANEAIIERLLE